MRWATAALGIALGAERAFGLVTTRMIRTCSLRVVPVRRLPLSATGVPEMHGILLTNSLPPGWVCWSNRPPF